MGFTAWLIENWTDLFQSAGIIGSLWFANQSFRFDGKVRRVANLFEIAEHQRQIWSNFYTRPELARVREPNLDLQKRPITTEEDLFVTQVILHLSNVFHATKEGVIKPMEGMETDIQIFFGKPIPEEVWRRRREFQDSDFVQFVEALLR